ncbi:MAG: glycosyltransferase family 4 protein, partial [Anaerolineae bacterium]
MIGPFGLAAKSTMRERALPMARALAERGHRVAVIVPPWDNPEAAGQRWTDAGVDVINTPLPRAPGPLYHLQLSARLARLAMERQPDVIHLFKPKAYAGLAHLLLRPLKRLGRHRAKLVVDSDDWERAWNALNDYTPLQKRFFAWQEPWGLTHADAVTVASQTLRQLVEGLQVPPQKIFYLPNGVRPANGGSPLTGGAVRGRHNLLDRPVILLYTRFFEYRLDFLLAVVAGVARLLPEARWLVVGRGYFGEQVELARLAKEQNLTQYLVFAGWVAQAELPRYFAAANAAFHPYDDTLINRAKCSVKLLDLLAAGVPVVA